MLHPEPAASLAALRIVVPAMILLAPGFREGVSVAGWDPARWVVPEGLGWFVQALPIGPKLARAAQVVTAFSALCAAVGVVTRPALVVLLVSAFYLFSIAQLTGFVWHDMHLLWLVALLAVSPCGDVLGFDATRSFEVTGERYATPLWFYRLLLSAIYFFPGLHKLLTSGVAWALSDNLRNQLYYKWAQHGVIPAFRIDQHPALLAAGGLFVLGFELGFPLLVGFRRTRPYAALLGVAFHLLSSAIFRIPFASLWLTYVALIDVRPALRLGARIVRRQQPQDVAAEDGASARRPWLLRIVGCVLVAGAVIQGARGQMRSYPFACYPTFQWRATTLMPDLGIYALDASGNEREIPHARDARGYRTQRQWAELWSLAGVYGPASPERLRAYLGVVLETPAARALLPERVRVYRLARSVVPEERGEPPEQRVLLIELERDTLGPGRSSLRR
jgi:hypothetical protein